MASGINELIDQLYASISDAKGFPLSVDKCILDRDNALDLLDEIRAQLPAEVAEAKRLVSAKAEVIRKTKEDAEQIKKDAAAEAARMVEKESIVVAAKRRAQEIVDEAQQKSDELRRASSAYADELLKRTEDTLNQALEGVRRSRTSFRSASGISEF
jgi:cell division septum initiation protein DivIVA